MNIYSVWNKLRKWNKVKLFLQKMFSLGQSGVARQCEWWSVCRGWEEAGGWPLTVPEISRPTDPETERLRDWERLGVTPALHPHRPVTPLSTRPCPPLHRTVLANIQQLATQSSIMLRNICNHWKVAFIEIPKDFSIFCKKNWDLDWYSILFFITP